MTDSDREAYAPPTLVEYGELETVTNGPGGSVADGNSNTAGHNQGGPNSGNGRGGGNKRGWGNR